MSDFPGVRPFETESPDLFGFAFGESELIKRDSHLDDITPIGYLPCGFPDRVPGEIFIILHFTVYSVCLYAQSIDPEFEAAPLVDLRRYGML